MKLQHHSGPTKPGGAVLPRGQPEEGIIIVGLRPEPGSPPVSAAGRCSRRRDGPWGAHGRANFRLGSEEARQARPQLPRSVSCPWPPVTSAAWPASGHSPHRLAAPPPRVMHHCQLGSG
ncbi:hypothetical protein E2C01_016226 [Portunus trituberculatus]|uniref:Uncharacterized protein n=1 Tax=Portunus trituberculatus TaxID=210409 RepID=A0A5B7DQ15_PORTR|nr:hypothetical protein [Portunus trituberculatus]